MPYFEIKTHQEEKTYSKPHFFILNKGLNSGKPLENPCPNCFVVTTNTEEDKNTLFHLSMMLQISGCYAFYLVGSVIPFLRIKDCREVLKNSLDNIPKCNTAFQKQIKTVMLISHKEKELKHAIKKVSELKIALIKSYLKH